MLKTNARAPEKSVSNGRTVYAMWLCPSCQGHVSDLGFSIEKAKMQSRETTFKRCDMCKKKCECLKANVQKVSAIVF